MSYSAGVYSLPALNPVVTGTTVSSTWANNTLNDIATALSTCLLKDGTQTATASVDLAQGLTIATTKLTVAAASGNTFIAGTAEVAGLLSGTAGFRTASGTTASTASATPVTLFNVSSQVGAIIVAGCVQATDAAVYAAASIVTCTNAAATAKITSLATGTNFTLTLTGAGDVQATQSSGSNQIIAYTYSRLVA